MDLGFYSKPQITALMSYCWPVEYDKDNAGNKALLLFGRPKTG
jgi:hypothetical protein